MSVSSSFEAPPDQDLPILQGQQGKPARSFRLCTPKNRRNQIPMQEHQCLNGGGPRVMIYSHDTYGLGHLRRSLLIARALIEKEPSASILVATGSPRAGFFGIPKGVDILKLPSVTKDHEGRYEARSMPLDLCPMLDLRSRILEAALDGFKPHVFLVDHAPLGVEGELLPIFWSLRRNPRRPVLLLGMRDIIDEREAVQKDWKRWNTATILRQVYDCILVYGDPAVLSTAVEMKLGHDKRLQPLFTGYLGRPFLKDPPPLAAGSGAPWKLLVTAGGGGDGGRLLEHYARFLEELSDPLPFTSVVVPGPFFSHSRREQLFARLQASGQSVTCHSACRHMEEHLKKAAGIICMGGYNTMVEVLQLGIPALIIPRHRFRQEQRLRAERLAPFGRIRVSHGKAALPREISRFVDSLPASPARKTCSLRLDGLQACTAEILQACTVSRAGSLPRGALRHARLPSA